MHGDMTTFPSDVSSFPDLNLSADQQELLLAALTSNDPAQSRNSNANRSPAAHQAASGTIPRQQFQSSPGQTQPMPSASGLFSSPQADSMGLSYLNGVGAEESPSLGYDLDFDLDPSFEVEDSLLENGQMIGNVPGPSSSTEGDADPDSNEKRKVPDDDKAGDDDAEGGGGGGGKRREGEDKTAKKPGRKPLTSEPTSKRKAQNRAAQRAFRDRKEKHLKDLETKVSDLEKASESANHENGLLRAQVERLNNELKEYRKRLSATAMPTLGRQPATNAALPPYLARAASGFNQETAFQFDFPKFGNLPGAHIFNNGSLAKRDERTNSSSPQKVPGVVSREAVREVEEVRPTTTNADDQSTTLPVASGVDGLSDLFSPSILQSVSKSASTDFPFPTMNPTTTGAAAQLGGTQLGSTQLSPVIRSDSLSATTSPSASSVSHKGPASSCGTSPEPNSYSPGTSKQAEPSLNTISEEQAASDGGPSAGPAPGQPSQASRTTSTNSVLSSMTMPTPTSELNGIDWMAQQNGGQFDPVLFADYREPQEAIISSDYDNYFNDAFSFPDLASPLQENLVASGATDDALEETAKTLPDQTLAAQTSTQISADLTPKWAANLKPGEKIRCGKYEFNVDDLCSEMKKKAKCTETGISFDEEDLNRIVSHIKRREAASSG